MHPHIHCTLSLIMSVESSESLYHRLPPEMSRKCMCGVDDHLAWKRLVSSETCREVVYNQRVQSLLLGTPLKDLPTLIFLEPPLTF